MSAIIESIQRADTTPAKDPRNAQRLGAFVSDATLEHENPDDFATVLAEYIADYRPTRGIETELVRQLAIATQRLRRFDRIENAVMFSDATAHTRHEVNVIMSEAFKKQWDMLEKIMKARAAAERSFNRVYKELEARRKARMTPRSAPTNVEIEVDTRHEPGAPMLRSMPKPTRNGP